MLSSIYLTGDQVHAQQFVGQGPLPDWRSFAVTKLQQHGVKVINPLELAYSFADCSGRVAHRRSGSPSTARS